MSAASDLPSDVSAWLSDPGFTPGAKHFAKLFSALATAERDDARVLERVLGRGGEGAGKRALDRLPAAEARERARLLGVLGRVAQGSPAPEFRAALLAALEHADERVRRVASVALGKLHVPDLSERLLARWPEASLVERRSLAEALGKSGDPRALPVLRAERASDPELQRIVERACLMLERDAARDTPSTIVLDRALGAPQSLVAHCRAGLSWVLAEEARRSSTGNASIVAPDRRPLDSPRRAR